MRITFIDDSNLVSQPDARIVTPRNQVITVRMKIQAPDCLHMPIECRIAVAVVKIPFLDDAVLVGWVYIIIGAGEANAFDARMMAVEWLDWVSKEIRWIRCHWLWRNTHFPRSLNSRLHFLRTTVSSHSPELVYRCQSRTSSQDGLGRPSPAPCPSLQCQDMIPFVNELWSELRIEN